MKNIWGALKNLGVLGVNKRNSDYLSEYNPRRFYPRADDKVLTKSLAKQVNIPVPELFGVLQSAAAFSDLKCKLFRDDGFVVKPCCGAGGEGILVITSVSKENEYQKANGEVVDEE